MKIQARFMSTTSKRAGDFEFIDLAGCFDIIFGEDSTATGAIRVSVRDGWIEVSAAEGRIDLQPSAANQIRVRTPESS